VIDGAGILTDPYDGKSLTEEMYKVLTDNELRRCLERVKLFSRERTAKETLKVYEELYGKKS
jgi:glycosyltransferase involved in cell wall biosynthesis